MALTSQEKAFLQDYQTDFNRLVLLIQSLIGQSEIYTSRSYSSISDTDLAEVEITGTNLSDSINLVGELEDFLGNEPVTQGDWQTIIDNIRRL